MEKEYILIKEKFNENFKQYKKHLKFFEKINNYETNYSNSYIDFFPYESIMNGYKPAILYKNKPLSNKNENFIENRIKDNEIYYSYNGLHKEWGSEFYFTDEQKNKTRLFYTNENDDEREGFGELSQLFLQRRPLLRLTCKGVRDFPHFSIHSRAYHNARAAPVNHACAHISHIDAVAQRNVFFFRGRLYRIDRLVHRHAFPCQRSFLYFK